MTATRSLNGSTALSAIETDIKRGAWADPAGAKVTVAEWWQHWLATVVDGRVGSTRSNYTQIVCVHLTPALGQGPLAGLTPEMVDQLLAVKADAGLVWSHVSRMRTVLAVGLRPGEVAGLLWSDLDRNGSPPTLTVSGVMKPGPDGRVARGAVKRSKDGRRTTAVPPRAVEALRSHRRRQLTERIEAGSQWEEQTSFSARRWAPAQPAERATHLRPPRQAGRPRPRRLPLLVAPQRRLAAVGCRRDPRMLYRHYRHKVRPVADLVTRMEPILAGSTRRLRAAAAASDPWNVLAAG